MQTVKSLSVTMICIALLSACGLKGPLYLPDEGQPVDPAIEQDSPLEIDSTDNVPTSNRGKKKKNS